MAAVVAALSPGDSRLLEPRRGLAAAAAEWDCTRQTVARRRTQILTRLQGPLGDYRDDDR